jgi:hypothetical protein
MAIKSFFLKFIGAACTLAALILTPTFSFAVLYHVDPSGSNTAGDGSTLKPWASLSYACSRVKQASSTIVINPGTYTDSAQCVLNPGVSIRGAGKDQTVIKSSLSDWYIWANSNPPVEGNQTISGFKIDGNNKTLAHGIWVTGRHHFNIDNVDLVSIKATAIQLQGYDYWPNNDAQAIYPPNPPPGHASGCTVSNVTIRGCSGPIPTAALWVQSVEDTTFDNVVIDESAGTGGQGNTFKSWPGWMRRCTIRNSTFTVNPALSMDAITIEFFNLGEDNEIYNSTFNEGYISLVQGQGSNSAWNLKFHDNRLINTMPLGYAHEIAVDHIDFYNNYITVQSLGVWSSKYVLSNIRIRNNVIYNTKGQGIVVQNLSSNGLESVEIYNNVIDTTYQDPKAGILVSLGDTASITNLKIKNNIILNQGFGVQFGGPNVRGITSPEVTYNNFFNVKTHVSDGGTTSPRVTNNLSVDPALTATGNRSDTYYRLRSSSPMIDAGTNVSLPFQGSAPDIGAFEFGSLSPPTRLHIVP